MRISKTFEIDKIPGTADGTRFPYHAPWKVGTSLYATDGRIMACVPIDSEASETDGPIPIEALAAARKDSTTADGWLSLNEKVAKVIGTGATFVRPDVHPPNGPELMAMVENSPKKTKVCIDPFLLAKLAKALGAHKDKITAVTLEIPEEEGAPILVVAQTAKGMIAVCDLTKKGKKGK